jgi:hypothetical protein
MSGSNIFNGGNFNGGIPINDAYKFNTFSEYISNGGLNTQFSHICIFCSSKDSTSLISDGSFKQCNRCKKQFKARLN